MNKLLLLAFSAFLLLFTASTGYSQWIDDTTFNVGTGADNLVSASAVQSDGKIILGGGFTHFNSVETWLVVRLNTDGSVDNTFQTIPLPENEGNGHFIQDIQIQPDGKILVAGYFDTSSTLPYTDIVRLNTDGTIDTTFSPITIMGHIYRVTILSNGKIMLSGSFNLTIPGAGVRNSIAMLNADGTPDESFSYSGTQSIYNCYGAVENADGSMILAGSFLDNASVLVPSVNIMRVSAGGAQDFSFNQGAGANDAITRIRRVADNKLLISGLFYEYNGTSISSIARLNADGSLDTTFVPAAISQPTYFQVQPDGKIMIGNDSYLKRLNEDGSLDSSFIYAGSYISTFSFTGENKIVLGGDFSGGRVKQIRLAAEDEDLPVWMSVVTTATESNSCTGTASLIITGNAPFSVIHEGQTISLAGNYMQLSSLCGGLHSITVADNNGDTLASTFVIASPGNYYYTNPYPDSTIINSFGVVVENCEIDYANIDTAYIFSVEPYDSAFVTINWDILYTNGSQTTVSVQYPVMENGIYLVQLALYCTGKSSGQYAVITQVFNYQEEVLEIGELKELQAAIFPNPASEKVTIRFDESQATLTLLDVNGKQLLSRNVSSNEQIDLSGFANGVYLFELSTEKGRTVKRIVKN